MKKKPIHIIIVESSNIIYEGLHAILNKTELPLHIHCINSISELQQINIRYQADIICINPVFIQNQLKNFIALKTEFENTQWIGIVHSFFDQQILSSFNYLIYINDSPCKIITLIKSLLITNQLSNKNNTQKKFLSDREIDVLKLLIDGNSNKKIAESLNISVNTIISHRKNISQKTGINSVSGLTIYAIINKIISIDPCHE